MILFRTDRVACLCFFLLCILLFTRSLNIHGLEYRDDEIFYYQATQEMVATGDTMSPTYFGEDRFQKPILYYWLVFSSFKIFGANWFSARMVAVIFAGLTVCLTWLMARMLFSRSVATLSAGILMTIPLFLRHAKNAVPDMVLNFFVVWALYCALLFIQSAFGLIDKQTQDSTLKNRYSILFFVACALGFMIKGYTAVIVPFATLIIFSLWIKKASILSAIRFGRGLCIMALIIFPWFLFMVWTHGASYLEYMLVDETKNRIVTGQTQAFIGFVKSFFDHALFYLNVIGSYFAPWSVFLIGGLPLAFKYSGSSYAGNHRYRFLLTWFLVVFCFFSMIYFAINHYVLVLSTPFAILVSCFLLQPFERRRVIERVICVFRKYMALFIFVVGCLAYVFLFIFLAGGHKAWMAILFPAIVIFVIGIIKSTRPITAPISLSLLLIFVFAQSSLLGKAGITSHAVLQKFAATINQDMAQNAAIGVGSHDIHEKEFQVYFDRKVIKAASSDAEDTGHRLNQLFSGRQEVYCLLTEQDYNLHLQKSFNGRLDIIQEDYIVRRRMSIDKGFFIALLKFDQDTVNHYFKEKLVLVKKKNHA